MSTQDEKEEHLQDENIQAEEQIIAESEATSEEPESPEDIDKKLNKESDWEKKYHEINDKYLRLYSEFDNFRRRTAKEKIEYSKTAGTDIITAILPVLDDIERAQKAIEAATEINAVKEGVDLIQQKLWNQLHQKGLEKVEAQGKEFDADIFEAITSIPAPDESMKGKVVDVVENGYSLNGKVIRFAKVVVGS